MANGIVNPNANGEAVVNNGVDQAVNGVAEEGFPGAVPQAAAPAHRLHDRIGELRANRASGSRPPLTPEADKKQKAEFKSQNQYTKFQKKNMKFK